MLLPFTFVSLLHSPEDYYERWSIGSLIRLRLAAIGITLFLPALYIAILSFHPGMIPFKLVFSIRFPGRRAFPCCDRSLTDGGYTGIAREAGIRLPKPIGQTIGIVGGLVIGRRGSGWDREPDYGYHCGTDSDIVFAIPSYSAGISFRIALCNHDCASILGLYGIVLTFIMICIHLMRRTFGIPYLSPVAPSIQHDWKDMFIRVPVTWLTRRPLFMKPQDIHRAKAVICNEQ